MKKWLKIFDGIIPKQNYSVLVQNSEQFGLIIKLEGTVNIVNIFFGAQASIRMHEEGIIPLNTFDGDDYLSIKKSHFSNTIYMVEGEKFEKFVKDASADLYEFLDKRCYVIFTMNYVIEIVTSWEPEITVSKNL